ncbi:hypothetical protein [Parafrankia sp. FMc2]|uniref:hypothetical protein n=1 Tax=Parafrankia sp. FMc2 TaxID=3233196 RepID=UPI0034D79B3C
MASRAEKILSDASRAGAEKAFKAQNEARKKELDKLEKQLAEIMERTGGSPAGSDRKAAEKISEEIADLESLITF